MANTTNTTGSRSSESDVRGVGENVGQTMKERAEEFKEYGEQVRGRVNELPRYGRDVFNWIDRSARSNPWMHVGIAGVGGLLIGLALGRAMSSDRGSEIVGIPDREYLREEEDFEIDS